MRVPCGRQEVDVEDTLYHFNLPPPNLPGRSGLGSGLHLRGYGAKSNNSYLAHWQNLAAGVLFQILCFAGGIREGVEDIFGTGTSNKMYLRRIEIHMLIHMQQQVYCFCMLLPFYAIGYRCLMVFVFLNVLVFTVHVPRDSLNFGEAIDAIGYIAYTSRFKQHPPKHVANLF